MCNAFDTGKFSRWGTFYSRHGARNKIQPKRKIIPPRHRRLPTPSDCASSGIQRTSPCLPPTGRTYATNSTPLKHSLAETTCLEDDSCDARAVDQPTSSEDEEENGSENPSTNSATTKQRTFSGRMDIPETYFPSVATLDPGHPFGNTEIIAQLTNIAVEKFFAQGTNLELSEKWTTSQDPKSSHKRVKLDPHIAIDDAGQSDSEDTHLVHDSGATPSRIWKCPFYIKDPRRHVTCLTRHCLLTTHDVSEHLCVMHRQPLFCAICYEVFSTEEVRDVHIRQGTCTKQQPISFEGVGDAQVRRLDILDDDEDDSDHTQMQRWSQIWETVFPGTRPPSPAVFTSHRELIVYELRSFWKLTGSTIIADVLRERDLQSYEIKDEERNLDALYCLVADLAVDRVFQSSDF